MVNSETVFVFYSRLNFRVTVQFLFNDLSLFIEIRCYQYSVSMSTRGGYWYPIKCTSHVSQCLGFIQRIWLM